MTTSSALNTGLLSKFYCLFIWSSQFVSRQLFLLQIFLIFGFSLEDFFFSFFLLHWLEFMGLFFTRSFNELFPIFQHFRKGRFACEHTLSSLQIRKYFRITSKFQVLGGKINFISNIRFQSLEFNFELKFSLKECINNPTEIILFGWLHRL